MNKIYVVGLVAVALFAFACAEDDVYSSDVSSSHTNFSSSAFTNESSSSSGDGSSSVSASSFPVDPSSSSSAPIDCAIGQYAKGKECLNCSTILNCYTCKDGASCESCSGDYKLENSICVVDCEKKFGSACSRCNDRKCLDCQGEGCCLKMKWWFNSTAKVCVDPVLVFGEGCLETDGTVCTKCTAQTCCADGEFYDFGSKMCKACTVYGENCSACVIGSCLNCGEGASVNSSGHCVECGSLYGSGCVKCNASECTEAAAGAVIIGTNAVQCSALFGSACTDCGLNGCTDCSEGYYLFDGYCKTCSQVFGEHCSSCDNATLKCTGCTGEGIVKVDDVCVSCSEAFGAGCDTCTEEGCLTPKPENFVSYKYGFSCEILPEEPKADCKAGNAGRGIDMYLTRDGFQVNYKGTEYPASCSALDEKCSTCETKGEGDAKQSVCTACADNYILYGGACMSCPQLFGEQCSACSKTACTKCNEGYNLTKEGKCVQCAGETPYFDETTKTCVSCSALYSHCEVCGVDGCSKCEGDYISVEGKCQTCMAIYGEGCSKCNATHCLDCKNDKCCAGETHLHVVGEDVKCDTCAGAFDEKCTECSMSVCTKCADNLIVDPIEHKCKECSNIFTECSECNSDECFKCTDASYIKTANGCQKPEPVDSSSVPAKPSQQSQLKPLSSGTESSEKKSNGGMIAGIVIACIVVVAIVAIAVYCVVTSGKKKGKIDPAIYEDDPEFISMSVL